MWPARASTRHNQPLSIRAAVSGWRAFRNVPRPSWPRALLLSAQLRSEIWPQAWSRSRQTRLTIDLGSASALTASGLEQCSAQATVRVSSDAMACRWRSVSDPIDLSSRTAACARNARDRTSPQPRWLANSCAIGMRAISDGHVRTTSAADSCPSAIRVFSSERARRTRFAS